MQLLTTVVSSAASAARKASIRAASHTTLRLGLVAVATVAVVVACDRVNLTAPTGSTVSLSVEKNVLPLGGQTTVTAVVTESAGTAVHNGTVVTFQTTHGSLNPPTATTVNGVATTTFLAGSSSGTATIHAFSGAARTGSGNSSSGGVSVQIGAAAASGNISVSATPPSVSQSGGTVAVSAVVFDSNRNPLPGVNVQFTTTTGTLSPTTANTDENGIARTQLTTTQTATVTAFAGSATGSARVDVSAAPNVQVAAPENGTVGTAVPVTVTFSAPTGSTGTPNQVATLVVDFGDGTSETRTNVTGQVALTHTYQQAGGYTITARATDVAGNTGIGSDAVVISHAPPPTISAFSASPNPIPPDKNGVTQITVTAAPGATNVPIRSVVVRKADGTVIYSATQGGVFTYQFQPAGSGATPITATVTDANGNTATSNTVVVVQ